MPQFDLSTFTPQIFWLIVCFSVIYGFTVSYSVPRLKKILDSRWRNTQGFKLEAERIMREVTEIQGEIDKSFEDARTDSAYKITATMRRVGQETNDRKLKILQDMKEKYATAELRVAESKIKALVDAQGIVQTLSTDIIVKLFPTLITNQNAKEMVEMSTKERAVNDR